MIDLPIAGPNSEGLTDGRPSRENGTAPRETLPLPMELAGSRESFLYTVEKNYSQESIVSGDLVIVDRADTPNNGDMVLSRGPSGVGLTRLTDVPEDPSSILGRVVGVIRKLERS